MNVGKDPFPRDEVTGLAAFEHLEPVGTVSVISDKSRETAVLTEANGEDTVPKAEPTSNNNAEREPITRPRADATLPLDLSAMPHWPGTKASPASEELEEEAPAVPKKRSALDAMFEQSAGLEDWEDEDEATRVHSRPAGRSTGDDGALDMEWDDADEPPTETLPFALLDASPIVERIDPDQHLAATVLEIEDDEASPEPEPRGASSLRSATPTLRTTTPPLHLHNTLPPQQLGANLFSGGRPSPFPAATSPDATTTDDSLGFDDDDSDSSYDSAFKNLMPLPAPELPVPQAQPLAAARGVSVVSGSHDELSEEAAAQETPARFIDALKAGHRPSVIIAAGGAIGLLALVIIARAIALTTNVGTAILEVSPADAQVQVDGKGVAGTGSPYSVSDLKAGSHQLLVTKRGYNDYHGSFAVSAGQSTKVPVIELAPNLLDVGFSVRSVPAGATVWLDGERTEALTPAKLTGIKPGIHRLALKYDGFADYELQMFVPEATVLQLPAAELVANPSPEPEPVNAKRRTRGSRADDLDARKARGAFRGSGETLTAVSARRVSSGYNARSSRRDEEDDAKSDAAASGGKSGTLRLNSRPWAQVTVDGRPVGNTPQPNLQLSAGKHKLVLSNPQLGVSKNVTVTIKAGETSTQVVNLAE